ncbi:ABC transporter permease OS=Ureibacillus acetophenoni OX=614649 GN=SAMN05877842_102392 PE=4 SV=1 [Ureibacillus acetophenoni]|uniref:ABC transporter permease n=1 Tax=Ureibacillus sp. MALMAid1270 TaxID=3411629 RepID=UPI003BA71B32
MITGQLERAFQLAEKHRLDVGSILDLYTVIRKELNVSPVVEEKILQQMIKILENNKTYLREAT